MEIDTEVPTASETSKHKYCHSTDGVVAGWTTAEYYCSRLSSYGFGSRALVICRFADLVSVLFIYLFSSNFSLLISYVARLSLLHISRA